MGVVKITLIKSVISSNPHQRKTVRALGLKKLNHFVERPDNSAVRGMISIIKHMIKVEYNANS